MKRKPTKAPRRLNTDMLAKRNRALPTQTRKVLGRHYAAKYRVR
ncbi:MAG: hypothetical protein ACJ8LN_02220 [Sulfurifustis sp.]